MASRSQHEDQEFQRLLLSGTCLEPFRVPCECYNCFFRADYVPQIFQSSLPYMFHRGPEWTKYSLETFQEASRLLREILETIIPVYGADIICMWSNKTVKQREEALKVIDPDLCPQDHPFLRDLFHAWDEDVTATWDRRNSNCREYCSYLNVERLAEDPARALNLLYYRTYSHPSEYAAYDAHQLAFPMTLGLLIPEYFEGSVVMSGDSYGSWRDLDLDAIHRQDHFSATKAMQVLRAQLLILEYLVSFTARLLGYNGKFQSSKLADLTVYKQDLRKLLGELRSRCSELKLRSSTVGLHILANYVHSKTRATSTGSWKSFQARHEAMPFQRPYEFPIDFLSNMVRDKMHEAQDDLWLIQTDPSSLVQRVRQLPKNRSFEIRGAKSRKSAAAEVCIDPIRRSVRWQTLFEELIEVREQYHKDANTIVLGQSIALAYENTLISLYHLALTFYNETHMELEKRFCLLPPVRRLIKAYKEPADVVIGVRECQVEWEKGAEKRLSHDRSLFILFNLCASKAKSYYTQNLQHTLSLLEKSREVGSRAEEIISDSSFYGFLSDLTILSEVLLACELHRPAFRLKYMDESYMQSRSWWVHGKALKRELRPDGVRQLELDAMSKALKTLQKAELSHEGHGWKWLTRSELTHRKLNGLWRIVDEEVTEYMSGTGCPAWAHRHFHDALKFYKDPEHVAKVQHFHQQLRVDLEQENEEAGFYAIPSWGTSTEANALVSAMAKEKAKTRGPSTHFESVIAEGVKDFCFSSPAAPVLLYSLPSEDISVIDVLLSVRMSYDSKRTCSWATFTTLMTRLGFGVEACGGSMMRFKGTLAVQENGQRVKRTHSIMIHKPHPSPVMSVGKLRDIGRRFNRRFGWVRDNFE